MAREARQEQGERAGVAGRCGEQEERAKREKFLPDTGDYPAQNRQFLSFLVIEKNYDRKSKKLRNFLVRVLKIKGMP